MTAQPTAEQMQEQIDALAAQIEEWRAQMVALQNHFDTVGEQADAYEAEMGIFANGPRQDSLNHQIQKANMRERRAFAYRINLDARAMSRMIANGEAALAQMREVYERATSGLVIPALQRRRER